eukprot:7390887-Prymnesium_polylepis.2
MVALSATDEARFWPDKLVGHRPAVHVLVWTSYGCINAERPGPGRRGDTVTSQSGGFNPQEERLPEPRL